MAYCRTVEGRDCTLEMAVRTHESSHVSHVTVLVYDSMSPSRIVIDAWPYRVIDLIRIGMAWSEQRSIIRRFRIASFMRLVLPCIAYMTKKQKQATDYR